MSPWKTCDCHSGRFLLADFGRALPLLAFVMPLALPRDRVADLERAGAAAASSSRSDDLNRLCDTLAEVLLLLYRSGASSLTALFSPAKRLNGEAQAHALDRNERWRSSRTSTSDGEALPHVDRWREAAGLHVSEFASTRESGIEMDGIETDGEIRRSDPLRDEIARDTIWCKEC